MEWVLATIPIVVGVGFLVRTIWRVRSGQLPPPPIDQPSTDADVEVAAELAFVKSLYLQLRSDLAQSQQFANDFVDVSVARLDRVERDLGLVDDDQKYLKAEIAELFAKSDRVNRVLSALDNTGRLDRDMFPKEVLDQYDEEVDDTSSGQSGSLKQ